MRARPLARVLLPVLIFAALAGCSRYDYVVEQYGLTAIVSPGSSNVAVELDITYRVGATPKADGFKYVGHGTVRNLRCVDGAGNTLRSALFQEREQKITWYFAPVTNARQRVVVQFTLDGAVGMGEDGEVLSLPWAGVFRVPVEKARYEVVFNGSTAPRIIGYAPASFRQENSAAGLTLIADQSPLDDRAIKITFGPEWGGSQALQRRTERHVDGDEGRSSSAAGWVAFFIVASVVVVIALVIHNVNKKGSGGDGSGSGGCSGSSCGGGGCGGGGCGGGCGG